MNPALSQEFHLFCEQEHPQTHPNTDKNPYCVYGTLNQGHRRPALQMIIRNIALCIHIQISVCVHRDWCFEAFVDDTRSKRRPTVQRSGKASVCTAQEVALRIAALAHLQEKAPRGTSCTGRRGKVFFVSSLYVRVLQFARFRYRQTEMKHNIENKQVDNSSQPGPKPKTTTRVRVLQPARFGYTGASGNEAHQILNKEVENSSLPNKAEND